MNTTAIQTVCIDCGTPLAERGLCPGCYDARAEDMREVAEATVAPEVTHETTATVNKITGILKCSCGFSYMTTWGRDDSVPKVQARLDEAHNNHMGEVRHQKARGW